MNPKQPRGELSVRSILATFAIFILVIILAACAAATATPASEAPSNVAVPLEEATTPVAELPVTTCDVLLPPEACNPEWESQIVYTPLIDLPNADCEKRLLDNGVGRCIAMTYNDQGQDFTITVEGADATLVHEYINAAKAYFIVQSTGGVTPPNDQKLPSLSTILVETSAEYAKLSQAELSAERDRIVNERGADGESVTLADVLFVVSGENPSIVDIILETAVARATAEATSAGLSQEEIDAIPEALQALMDEPGTKFLFDPALFPQDDSAQLNALMNDPTSLLITMEWSSAPTEETKDLWVVWYSFDPPISLMPIQPVETVKPNAVQSYKEKCNVYSASAGIRAVKDSMTLHFWRVSPYYFVGTKTADMTKTPAPSSMTHSSYPTKVKYDAKVVGGPKGGIYYIIGGWVQGSGCQ